MNKLFKIALAALPMLMLASCAKDDLGLEDDIAKKSETRYLQVTLSSANGSPDTRAEGDPTTPTDPNIPKIEGNGTYEVGTVDENKIKTLEFYFYDVNKNFHSYKSMSLDLKEQDSDGSTDIDPDPVTDKPNIGGFYHCNVPVELIQGSAMPRYVICIINSVEGSSYINSTLEDAQKKTLGEIYGAEKTGDKRYFGMSNSVYYGMDEVISQDDQLIMATPFPADALKTETELNAMTDKEREAVAVNIYVERYAAKVNLNLGGSEATKTPIKDYTAGGSSEGTTVALRFDPKAWRVNGTEKRFFFLKAFRTVEASTMNPQDGESAGTYGNEFETFETMNRILFNGWNNEDHHRSFWARTPGYYSNNYPIVADDMKKPDGTYDKNRYDVNYYSYEECYPFEGKYAYSDYVMETTMKQQRLTGDGMGDQFLPTAAVPSVILVGQYKVVGAAEDADPIDLYAYGKQNVTVDGKTESRSSFYTGEEDKDAGKALGLSTIKEKMMNDQTIILEKITAADGTVSYSNYDASTVGDLAGKFTVQHPSEAVRMAATTAAVGEASGGGLKVAADIVVLQLTSYAESDNLYFYNPSTNAYEQINAGNVDVANRLLLQNLGGAHLYKDGMAFFFAPIQHWGWYRTANDKRGANPNAGKTMNEWDWTQMRTGDFGIVRNHIYTLKIGEITGLGTAIKDPTEPIIPPADKVSYMVHFHVNIQKWAVLPTQTWNW